MKYVLICFMLLVNVTTLEATERTQKRVLYISSYSYSWETVPAQIRGIEKVLSGKVHIDYEFMDSKLSESAYYQNLFKNKITYRMERVRPYDSIIVGDDPALDFVWHNHVDLFKSTPVVFLGINDLENAAIYHKYADFTGVFEKNDYAASISMACKVNPKAKNIVAILDDTISGKAERRQFYAQVALYPNLSFGEINASKLSRQEFREALSKISKETILMFVICSNDRYGNIYQDYEVEDIIFNNAPVPAYSFNRMGVGDGLFGGRLVSHEKSGEIVGRMVLEILYGKAAKSIKVIDNPPAAYIFDYNIAKKYNIDKELLPEETIWLNYQPSFWENNKNYIVLTIFCVLLAVTLAVMLLQSDHDRQQAQLIAEKKVKEAELKKALEKADKDAFTGLYNKAATQELIQKKLAMLSGSEKAALAIIDMDKFKHINDTLGHLEGDRVILQFAGLLKEFFRAEDLLGRVGGDEFIVFMSGLTQDGIAYERTNKFVNFINRKYCSGELLVTISVGVAIASVATKSFEELYAKADEAMYRDKSQAKNPCDGKGCVRQGR